MSGVGDVTYFTDAATQTYVSEITAVTIMKAAGPMMLGLVVLEALLSIFRLQKTHRLNDTINRYAPTYPFTTPAYGLEAPEGAKTLSCASPESLRLLFFFFFF